MTVVHEEPDLTPAELLQAASRLKSDELDQFLAQLLALRAKQSAPSVPAKEAELLQRINAGLPQGLAAPYQELIAKRRAATLTAKEHQELLRLTELVEAQQAKRVECLIELSRLRGQTLDKVMRTLGIQPPLHA